MKTGNEAQLRHQEVAVITKFTIDRSKWRCGGDSRETMRGLGEIELLNTEGFMCCLGQIARQCGVNDEDLLEQLTPRVLPDESAKKVSPFLVAPFEQVCDEETTQGDDVDRDPHGRKNLTALCTSAVNINDDMTRTDTEREQDLISLFSSEGYVLEFTGEFVRPTQGQPEL